MRDVSKRDTSVTVLGRRLPFPIAVGPAAFHKLAHPDGERATVKGGYDNMTYLHINGN